MSRIQQAIASKKGSVTTFMKRVAIACPGTNRNRENQRPSAKPIGVIRYRSFDCSRAFARKQSSKRLRRFIPIPSYDFATAITMLCYVKLATRNIMDPDSGMAEK